VIRMVERKLTVVKPMKETPASRQGIKAGDHIVRHQPRADREPDLERGVDRIARRPEHAGHLICRAQGQRGPAQFDLLRAVIRVSQVEHKLLDNGVAISRSSSLKGIAADVADAMTR